MIDETRNPETTEKLGEAILHIASRCRQMRAFGRTKLNKVLFFADFAAFQQIGRPVTEATYLKKPNGPVVSQLPKTIERMVRAGFATEVEVQSGPFVENRLQPLRAARLSVFTSDEIRILDEAIDDVRELNAAELSEMTHETEAWRLAVMDGAIPLMTALIPRDAPELTDAELAYAAELSGAAGGP